GPELFVNNDFSDGLDGWTVDAETFVLEGGGVGRSSTGVPDFIHQTLALDATKQYRFEIDVESYSKDPRFRSPSDGSSMNYSAVNEATVVTTLTGEQEVGIYCEFADIYFTRISLREIL